MISRQLRPSCLFALMFTFGRPALPSPPALVPRVDPRVELLSIVFRLAGNSEYQMSPLKSYTEDIDAYFAPYKDHPAVLIAKKLASERDVGFDAVMNLAVHLSFPPALIAIAGNAVHGVPTPPVGFPGHGSFLADVL